MNRDNLIELIKSHQTSFNEEINFKTEFLDLLEDFTCFFRYRLAGHITASCWITDPDLQRVLLLHHKKLDRWLQPGGHADGEQNLYDVASKELGEETGLKNYSINGREIFDIDIHTIPLKKDVPEHLHYDVRFHYTAHNPDEIRKNHESFELKWVELDEVTNLCNQEKSISRMVEKTQLLKNHNAI